MNAHTPNRQIASASPLKTENECPVAALGRDFARINDRESELAQAPSSRDACEAASAQRLGLELLDAGAACTVQAEWLEAQSLEGVYFQLLQLGRLMREIQEEDGLTIRAAQLMRSFHRFQHLALQGLERLGSFDGEDYGKRHVTLQMREFEDVEACLRTAGGQHPGGD